jgi:hypothetical protein
MKGPVVPPVEFNWFDREVCPLGKLRADQLAYERYVDVHFIAERGYEPFSTMDALKFLLHLLRVSKVDTMSQTNIVSAGRDKALIDPVITQVAFLGNGLPGIIPDCVIRASGQAKAAACASLIIHHHNAVISSGNRIVQARVYTRGVVAVSADVDLKNEIQLTVNKPGAVFKNRNQLDPVRGPVFLFAGHLTGFATPAGFMIDKQRVNFH